MATALSISLSGMADATLRVANAANNIANASSEGKLPDGTGSSYTGFVPQDVMTLSNDTGPNNLGVRSVQVPRDPAYNVAYDPTSSQANAQGSVGAPNVNLASEIISLKSAAISYAADAKVVASTNKMYDALFSTIA